MQDSFVAEAPRAAANRQETNRQGDSSARIIVSGCIAVRSPRAASLRR